MSLSIPNFIYNTHERDVEGNNFMDLTSFNSWYSSKSNNHMSQDHPILTPAILFVSKIFSQAKFEIKNDRTERSVKKHWMLSLLKKPNAYQTGNDFLETLMFSMIANGVAVVYKKSIIGFDEPESMFILNYDLIIWPDNFKTKFTSEKDIKKLYGNKTIEYRDTDGDVKIKISDLLFFYDLPNMMNRNPFHVKSRLDGLKQTLINTQDSLLAKNIILKSNGKEMITGSGKTGDFPLGSEEKNEAEKLFNGSYGLGSRRRRGLITKANLTWKSLHIALRDLGLDESVKVDGNLIYTALHIPKDIMSLEAKKTTYNNFKESMVSYLQNEMQSSLNSVVAVLNEQIEGPNLVLSGNYEHLPIMQFILIERYEGMIKRSLALKGFRLAGLPDEICLELTGFDKTIKLNPITNGKEKNKKTGDKGDDQIEEFEEEEINNWLKSV